MRAGIGKSAAASDGWTTGHYRYCLFRQSAFQTNNEIKCQYYFFQTRESILRCLHSRGERRRIFLPSAPLPARIDEATPDPSWQPPRRTPPRCSLSLVKLKRHLLIQSRGGGALSRIGEGESLSLPSESVPRETNAVAAVFARARPIRAGRRATLRRRPRAA